MVVMLRRNTKKADETHVHLMCLAILIISKYGEVPIDLCKKVSWRKSRTNASFPVPAQKMNLGLTIDGK